MARRSIIKLISQGPDFIVHGSGNKVHRAELIPIGAPFTVSDLDYVNTVRAYAHNGRSNAYAVGLPHFQKDGNGERVFPVQMYRIPENYVSSVGVEALRDGQKIESS